MPISPTVLTHLEQVCRRGHALTPENVSVACKACQRDARERRRAASR